MDGIRNKQIGIFFTTLMLITILANSSFISVVEAGYPQNVVVNEYLVSSNGETYNGTDWNGDGEYGNSNQFIELYNPTNADVDISQWKVDDAISTGSEPCVIANNTILKAGEYVVFYNSITEIFLNFDGGDSVVLSDNSGSIVDQHSFAAYDSDWDTSYARDANADWTKIAPPTPGNANDETWVGTQHDKGACQESATVYSEPDFEHTGSYILNGRVVTMDDANGVIEDGNVLVTDGMIAKVWDNQSGETVPGVQIVYTHGTIYPGLINTHSHVHYNHIPLWDYELENGQFYTNRYQWKDNDGYSTEVTAPKNLLEGSSYWKKEYEVMKYAEMKAIVGGTTAIQGNPVHSHESFGSILARNIEFYNFGSDYMHSKVSEISWNYTNNGVYSQNQSGNLEAWFLHLAEGTDEVSREEFERLKSADMNGDGETGDMLVGELMVIHGVALEREDFEEMAEVGASLVWSPTSNMLLYGETAKVDLVNEIGIKISLAPDWAPSGAKNLLHELKIADWWNQNKLDNTFTNRQLIEMVTINPADEMNWQMHVGRVKEGLQADLVVIDTFDEDPYRNMIDAVDPDVLLTTAGGMAVMGDEVIMQQLKGTDYEIVNGDGFAKAIDITFPGIDHGEQTWTEIVSILETGLQFDTQQMYDNFSYAEGKTYSEFEDWIEGKYPGLDPVPLDPLFTFGDQRYFSILNNSQPFNSQGQIDLWSYYDIELDENGRRVGGNASQYLTEVNITITDNTPAADSDNDGVPDSSDMCPNSVGVAEHNGCAECFPGELNIPCTSCGMSCFCSCNSDGTIGSPQCPGVCDEEETDNTQVDDTTNLSADTAEVSSLVKSAPYIIGGFGLGMVGVFIMGFIMSRTSKNRMYSTEEEDWRTDVEQNEY